MKLTRKQKILLIERLDLLGLPLWIWCAWRCQGGFFVGSSGLFRLAWFRRWVTQLLGLRQLRYEDVPGTYFEVQRVVCTVANDALYEQGREAEAASIVAFLRRLRDHELIEVALRRALENCYTVSRIKTFVLLRELTRSHGEVVFFPCDDRDPKQWVPESLLDAWKAATRPRIVKLLNALRSRIEPLTALVFAGLFIARLIVRRGVIGEPPPLRRWSVGYDLFDEGVHWDKLYHEFFLYDENRLSPQSIVHVVRDRLSDDRSRHYFVENKIPFVEAGSIPIPRSYLRQKILRQLLPGILSLALSGIWKGKAGPFLRAAVQVCTCLIKAELLETNCLTDIFLGRDEYSVAHIVRTLLHDQRGGKTIGFSHGDDPLPTPANSYQCFHVFCFPAPFHEKILEWNTRYSRSTRIIGAGLYGLDETYRRMQAGAIPAKYAELRKRHRIVGAFASSFQEDFFITREITLRFYRMVLAIPDRYPDVVLVLKPKGQEFRDPEFRELLREAGPRVVLEEEVWTYDLIPALDLMICIAVSTVGLEGLMAGRRVIYFDESNFLEHPYAKYDPMLVARSPEDLLERVECVLERDEYVDPAILKYICDYHGFAFDGKVVERLRQVIYAAIAKVNVPGETSVSSPLLGKGRCQPATRPIEQLS